jgi:hypothetical protein
VKNKPALFAAGFMESNFVRYLIQDEWGRFWTGKGFTKQERKALAYADEGVILRDMRRILKRRCKGMIRHRFVAPVMIDVYAEGQIDQEELACLASIPDLSTADGIDSRKDLTKEAFPCFGSIASSPLDFSSLGPSSWLGALVRQGLP